MSRPTLSLARRLLGTTLALALGWVSLAQAQRSLRLMRVDSARTVLEMARKGESNALEIADAIASAREAWQQDPEEPESAEVLGELLLFRLSEEARPADVAEAARAFEAWQRAHPVSARARARTAHLQLYFGDRARGEELLAEALTLAPHERPLWSWAAEEAFTRALTTGNPSWKERAVERWAEVNRGAGDRVAESLAQLALLDDSPDFLRRATPDSYAGSLALGEQLWDLGHLEAAAQALEDAVKREPWRPRASFSLGCVRLEQGSRSRAAEALWHALEVERRDRRRLVARVLGACFDRQAFDLQLDIVERIAQRWPAFPDIDLLRARARLDAGDPQVARSILRQRSDRWSNPEAAFLLATAERRLGELESARQITSRALEAAPRDARLEALRRELEQ